MKRVVVESPLSGDREKHKFYARLCMLDCLRRMEAPYASHVLLDHADVLDDTILEQRTLGMEAGFAWGAAAELVVVYEDLGRSSGMRKGVARALDAQRPVEYRMLPQDLYARFKERYPE